MKRNKYKIGEMKKRCRICGDKLPDYVQDQYNHIMKYHLEELPKYGILPEEIKHFKEGFKWEPSTISQPQWKESFK